MFNPPPGSTPPSGSPRPRTPFSLFQPNLVAVLLGLVLLFVGALDARNHFGLWSVFSILLGLALIIFGASIGISDKGKKKFRRRLALGFVGGALVFLAIALAIQP
jgi:predicted permease